MLITLALFCSSLAWCTEMTQVVTGRIISNLTDRGFGFIEPDGNGPDLFVHVSAFDNVRLPEPGTRVAFTIGEGRNGKPCALKLTVLE
jgi:cold shock CspA family protein